jgi:hypothetical protein
LRLTDQVAQKLHACTGPFSAGRARDILDILLIDTLGELNYAETGTAVRRVFEERATHDFPPNTTIRPEWGPELEALARDLGFPIRTVSGMQQRFSEFVETLVRTGEHHA